LVLSPACADPVGRAFAGLSGLTVDARLELRNAAGKKLFEWTDSLLFTHFGISGPGPMNLSRHWLRLGLDNPNDKYAVLFGHPALPHAEAADAWLREETERNPRRAVADALARLWPARLARLYSETPAPLGKMKREERLDLARRLAATPLAVAEPRGWSFAETTAGGVDLREIDSRTMASRKVPNLFLCGEMLDADGRIGGFNFQWAWASGYLAGRGAAAAAAADSH
jgi:predicted Rossmann fold flavoprotein